MTNIYCFTVASARADGLYTCIASSAEGSSGQGSANLKVYLAPSILTDVQPQSVTNNVGDTVTFTVSATGTPAPSYRWYYGKTPLNDEDNISGSATNTLTISPVRATNGGTYNVVVANACSSIASSNATLYLFPSIVPGGQPQSVVTNAGSSVTFSVSAIGFPDLSYQWLFNGNNISNATSTNYYTIVGVRPEDAGSYSVLVSNSCGSVTSSIAILQVTNTTVRLINVNVADAGGSLGFRVTGPVGSYVIWISTDLVSWASVATNSIPVATNLWWDYTDTGTAAFGRRFYRAQLQ